MKNKSFRHRTIYKDMNEDLIFLYNYEWRINDKLKREGVYDYRLRRNLIRKIYHNEAIRYYVVTDKNDKFYYSGFDRNKALKAVEKIIKKVGK